MCLDCLETKGDVTFYPGENGQVYQLVQLKNEQLMISPDLGLTEETRELPLPLQPYKTYRIRYDGLGETGFSIWDAEGYFVDKGFWSIFEVMNHILDELEFPCARCEIPISFQGTDYTPCFETCTDCEEQFCPRCVKWLEEDQAFICRECLDRR